MSNYYGPGDEDLDADSICEIVECAEEVDKYAADYDDEKEYHYDSLTDTFYPVNKN